MIETSRAANVAQKLSFGTYEEARAWVGMKTAPRACEDEINWTAIKDFCALVQDANPNYWDEATARSRFGAIVSPPGMLMVWQMRRRWNPAGQVDDALLATQVPLPGDTIINISTDSEFFRPMKVGDRLTVAEEIVEITPEKRTRFGAGHFITTLSIFYNQHGELVARNRNVLFRFIAGAPAEGSR
ncbi:MAG: MaoC family dehydratase N-terminal domain-containing protein [Candidatus Binataceae bacterium]|jgi:acyl dehydratase